jgi:hypothetical protein
MSASFEVALPPGVRVDASTVNGRVVVTEATGDVEANTVNGDIRASTVGGALALTTVNGSIRARAAALTKEAPIHLVTVNGSVSAELPTPLDAEVLLSTVNGRITTDFPIASTGRMPERELRGTLGEQVPRLDLALMGLGPDAHTASLFPNDDALNETGRVAVGVQNAGMEPYVPRVTLTVPVFSAAREVLFLVTGRNKAEAVARAFADPPAHAAPASLIDPSDGEMTVLLDEAAAEGIGGQR